MTTEKEERRRMRENRTDQAVALARVIRQKDPELKHAFTPEVAERILKEGRQHTRMTQAKIEIGKFEERVRLISSEMEKGSIDALYEMKKLLGGIDYYWVEISGQTEPRTFFVVWALNAVIGELWSNLGPDGAGFPKKEGHSYVLAITKHLGQFSQQALSTETKEGLSSLCQAVTKVFELFWLVDDRLMREGIKPNEEWCFL